MHSRNASGHSGKDALRCGICRSGVLKYFSVYDDRYGYPGLFEIYQCPQCGHKAIPGNFSSELLTRLYTDFYPRSSLGLDHYRPLKEAKGFRAWMNGERCSAHQWVPGNVRVLDIGCGFGEALGYHTARHCDVYGVDADENIRRIADAYGFKVHVGLFDSDVYEADFFDYVTVDQVIEHVADPVLTMKAIARVLKPDGIAIVSTPNANGWGARVFGRFWINWHAPYHRQFFSRCSMKAAAEQAGLMIMTVRTITSSEWLFYQWIHLLTRPPLGTPSPFWSPRAARTLTIKMILGVLLAMHYTKINHGITRLFDALGIGDNALYFLKKA